MIKTIVCTGDSHTWGQGGFNLSAIFPDVVGGEHRLAPFDNNDAYVNAIRRAVNKKTNSTACDFTGEKLSALFSAPVRENCIVCENGKTVTAKVSCALFRLQLRLTAEKATASITVDGKKLDECCVFSENLSNPYNALPYFCDSDGEHTLSVTAAGGDIMIYRLELYSGEYAVINSGIGSCPTERYMANYWEKYVTALKPYLMLIEGHTINDWLTRQPPEKYAENLDRYFTMAEQASVKAPIFLSVAPILGTQSEPCSPYEYCKLIEQSKAVAQKHGFEIADANAVMNERISGMSESEAFNLLFSDNWHLNVPGNLLYAEIALPYILKSI